MKVLKEFDPIEVAYSEYALNTVGKPYKLNKNRKWLRKFYKISYGMEKIKLGLKDYTCYVDCEHQ
jgi:hypothetical protein